MDITERLRALYVEHGDNYVQEAAFEIERLRRVISDGAKWVTVEERVPADDGTVLVCLHPGQIVTGWWAPGINEWRDCSNGARFVDMGMNVTHWMPLPEAPKVRQTAELTEYAEALRENLEILHDSLRLCDGRTDPRYHKSRRCVIVGELLAKNPNPAGHLWAEASAPQGGPPQGEVITEASGPVGLGPCVHETWRPARCCPVSVTCEREQSCSGMCPVRCRPELRHQSGNDAFCHGLEVAADFLDKHQVGRWGDEVRKLAPECVHQVCNVPEGWKLVPVEPTDAMLEELYSGGPMGADRLAFTLAYQDMLAAAPTCEFVAGKK